jgi:formylmethanofuran dehydrogenase subunit D
MCDDFTKAAALCFLSEEDFKALNLSGGRNVLIKSAYGRVVMAPRIDKGLPPGMIFMAMGPWANSLVGPDTGGCGTPQFKGIEVELETTDEPVMDLRSMFTNFEEAKT